MTQTAFGVRLEQGSARTRDGVHITFRWTGGTRNNLPRIALVHSLGLDTSVWDEVVAKLSAEAEILAIDCRGHGRSERAPGPYTVQMFGDDLADVLDHVGWRAVVAAGCSMGG